MDTAVFVHTKGKMRKTKMEKTAIENQQSQSMIKNTNSSYAGRRAKQNENNEAKQKTIQLKSVTEQQHIENLSKT